MHQLSDAVLRRGAERFRRALDQLGRVDSEPADLEPIDRMRHGLHAMEGELARRGHDLRSAPGAAGSRRAGSGDGASRAASGSKEGARAPSGAPAPRALVAGRETPAETPAETAAATTAAPLPASTYDAERPDGSAAESAVAPEPDPIEEPASTGSDAEPVWRLIPHLSGTSSKIVSVLDGDGRVRHQSKPIKWLLGFEADALVGEPLRAFLCPDCRDCAEEAVAHMARGEQKFDSWRFQFRTASGGSFWLEGMAANFLRDPRLGGILVYWRELTDSNGDTPFC